VSAQTPCKVRRSFIYERYLQLPSAAAVPALHREVTGMDARQVLWPFRAESRLRAVALLEFLLAATWAGVVAADVLQGVAHGLLMAVVAVRAVYMAMVVVVVIMAMVAVRAMNMGLLGHCSATPV